MSRTVENKGIFYNLPTFPRHQGKKYNIIVTGANGISGSHMVDVLASSPERWGTIYAFSRKLPQRRFRPNVKNIAADFLELTPEELKTVFDKEGIEHV
jgi:nucleoside-diphosphate-sugar epimerase